MRIYDGSPRQDFEEVFRSIGAFLDSRGMRDILVVEVPDGFVVQGLVAGTDTSSAWSETVGSLTKETLSFFDDDIAKFMEEAAARRGGEQPGATEAGAHERALRVIGHWIDSQKPKDVFLFEQDGAYVVRLLQVGQAGAHHTISEFTREDIDVLIDQGPDLRDQPKPGLTAAPPLAAGAPAPAAPAAAPSDAAAAGRLGRARQLIVSRRRDGSDDQCRRDIGRWGGHNQRPDRRTRRRPNPMKALRTVAVALGITLGALIVIPLVVLAGLFVWLKLTEEDDEEALELEQEGI